MPIVKKAKKLAPWVSAFPSQHQQLTRPSIEAREKRLAGVAARRRSQSQQPKLSSSSPRKTCRSKAIRRRSRKMTRLMGYYLVLKAEYLAEHRYCVVHTEGKRHRADQIHHKRGRTGTLLIDKRFWAGVCDCGHIFINDEPAMARRAGLLCEPGEWNTPPDDQETARLRGIIAELSK